MRAAALALLLVLAVAAAPAAGQARSPRAGTQAGGQVTVPTDPARPPAGRTRSARDVLRQAARQPEIGTLRRQEPRRTYGRAFLKGSAHWQVSFYAVRPGDDEEIAQVLIEDRSGRILETWTGVQVAWTMARGYEGAFGRKANHPAIWIGLLVLFLAPFARRPLRLLHLDLLVLASLSASYAFFNAARIDLSVPLAVPPLLYLMARLLLLARVRARRTAGAADHPLRLATGPDLLLFGIVFLVGFRLGLNLTASNVIDVGYAGVIGADRLLDGDRLYGAFPADNEHGDTYGPVAYLAYVPFELIFPWSGTWDALPAAHAAAIAFDLAATGGLYLLGRRHGGRLLGLLLAYMWLSFPFTLMVSNSNSNDALVSVLVIGCLLAAARPALRGVAVATAGLAKFAPLGLGPLLATASDGRRGLVGTAAAAAIATAVWLLPVLILDGDLTGFADRTLGFQLGRDSPFSVWGLYGLDAARVAATIAAVALGVAVAFVPRRKDPLTLAALAAAVLIALQLAAEHWFYLYVVWFLPPALLALVGGHTLTAGAEAARSTPRAAAPGSG